MAKYLCSVHTPEPPTPVLFISRVERKGRVNHMLALEPHTLVTDSQLTPKGRPSPKTIPKGRVRVAYRRTSMGLTGTMYQAWIEDFLKSRQGIRLRGKVNLIFTSPPFPLNRKKAYGNFQGGEYLRWLSAIAPQLARMLTPDGSIVIELGNAWKPGAPVMDVLSLRALLRFLEKGKLHLCQQFICFNKARLPSPAQWVNIERIRVKDAFTHVWWMAPTTKPKADNRRVLKPYSEAMLELLRTGRYNAGSRPSEYKIGEKSFAKNNMGAIRSNVLEFANTSATDEYRRYCKRVGLKAHPARMHPSVAEFFIEFLTDPGDTVMDPFGGSNTTGAAAQKLGRRWVSVEPNRDYIDGSLGRFSPARSRARSRGKTVRRTQQ